MISSTSGMAMGAGLGWMERERFPLTQGESLPRYCHSAKVTLLIMSMQVR